MNIYFSYAQCSRKIGKKNFTLIELLVVISIIIILISILLPSLATAKKVGKRISCAGKQRQLYLGSDFYSSDNNSWLLVMGLNGGSPDWRVVLQPYVAPKLKPYYSQMCQHGTIFMCPSYNKNTGGTPSGLGWNWHLGYYDNASNYPRIKQNTINQPGKTIMIGDSNDTNVVPAVFSPSDASSYGGIGNRHDNGVNTTFSDGHVNYNKSIYLQNHNELYNK